VSLVRNGPHTVTVFTEEESTDFRGNIVMRPSRNPVVISGCMMQPLASTRGAFAALRVADGQNVAVAFKLFCAPATVPVEWWVRVEWLDPITKRLRKFSVLGGPMPRAFSGPSDHLSITLSEMR
jgi:hypothetical protein